MSPYESNLKPDACYLALKARDARFDGSFFTGVTSTGIYCRPVCRVRTPKRENCRFFGHAAQAESAGFRPCLRCRPELAPHSVAWSIQDASAILAQQAARLLDEPEAWGDAPASVAQLASRLGVTDRHVRRIFEAQFGVSPVQYLQTRTAADGQAIAGRHRFAGDADRTAERLCQRAPLQRRFPCALRPQPDPVAAGRCASATVPASRCGWATGRRTTSRRCSASSASACCPASSSCVPRATAAPWAGPCRSNRAAACTAAGCWRSSTRRSISCCCGWATRCAKCCRW